MTANGSDYVDIEESPREGSELYVKARTSITVPAKGNINLHFEWPLDDITPEEEFFHANWTTQDIYDVMIQVNDENTIEIFNETDEDVTISAGTELVTIEMVELTSNTFPLTIQNHGHYTLFVLRESYCVPARTVFRIRIVDRISVDSNFIAGESMVHVKAFYATQILFIENAEHFPIWLMEGAELGTVI